MMMTSYKTVAEWRDLVRSKAVPLISEPVLLYADAESVPRNSYDTLQHTTARDFRRPSQAPLEQLRVIVISKKPNAPFQDQIGVGRTHTVDLVLPFALISKFHAFFTRTDDGYRLHDAESKHGTFVGGTRIEPNGSLPLGETSTVQLGKLVLAFMSAAAFSRLLEGEASLPSGS